MSIDDKLDLIWGAAAIAAVIGKSRNATYHMLERGQIPGARQLGDRQWVVSRKVLKEFFEGSESAA